MLMIREPDNANTKGWFGDHVLAVFLWLLLPSWLLTLDRHLSRLWWPDFKVVFPAFPPRHLICANFFGIWSGVIEFAVHKSTNGHITSMDLWGYCEFNLQMPHPACPSEFKNVGQTSPPTSAWDSRKHCLFMPFSDSNAISRHTMWIYTICTYDHTMI